MIIEAECHIDFFSGMKVRPIKRQFGKVDMNLDFSQGAGPGKPVTVIIKGKNAPEIIRLAQLSNKSEEDLGIYARKDFSDDVAGMNDKECADWVRGKILERLMELAGDNDESVRDTDSEG